MYEGSTNYSFVRFLISPRREQPTFACVVYTDSTTDLSPTISDGVRRQPTPERPSTALEKNRISQLIEISPDDQPCLLISSCPVVVDYLQIDTKELVTSIQILGTKEQHTLAFAAPLICIIHERAPQRGFEAFGAGCSWSWRSAGRRRRLSSVVDRLGARVWLIRSTLQPGCGAVSKRERIWGKALRGYPLKAPKARAI